MQVFMIRMLKAFLADADGATAIEYAMIAAIMGLGIIVGLQGLADGFNGIMNNVSSNLTLD